MPAQWIRPIDGDDGRERRGWFNGLKDILTGKGPDYFIGNTRHRGPRGNEWARFSGEKWSNTVDPLFGIIQKDTPLLGLDNARTPSWARRGRKRYDPISRQYKDWCVNWHEGPIDGTLIDDATSELGSVPAMYMADVDPYGSFSSFEDRPWKASFWTRVDPRSSHVRPRRAGHCDDGSLLPSNGYTDLWGDYLSPSPFWFERFRHFI